MTNRFTNDLFSLLGPIALIIKGKYIEVIITLVFIVLMAIFSSTINDKDKHLVFIFGCTVTSFTYLTLTSKENIQENLYNCIIATLVTLLFGFGIYAVLELSNINFLPDSSLSLLMTIINAVVIISTTHEKKTIN